ncbi:class I glutamine amidotransferase-like protein [Cucurbitaria berberidis CBS 394.84]|uniref:Class I glutamine amidotransferase-like protein n=1 Tax=Cucurbitaria berberidis CBS 394.84 TaxID=1168544 RepID=A0A9P4GEK8_9PLEO|nr:class I glutamine amidotransferase-like protein [Cucurbitaria berberidis CBS 394.84]KAF1844019.1 class I glutamine amidotransferase-like protein [Cucurbitaria berberidis CBS 394.84]
MVDQQPFNVLVFSKTSGYRHSSIPAGISSIHSLSAQTKLFTVHASEDASIFTPPTLARYSVILLLQCIGNIFEEEQFQALKSFVRNGAGVVAIHGAAAGMPDDDWYGQLIGAHFDMHPDAEPGTILVESSARNHYIVAGCGERQGWMDEWYNFRTHPRDNSNLQILLKGDMKSFNGGKMGDDHPLVWCQEFDGGRSFFTALGHFDEAYRDEWFLKQILGGILWAARREKDMDGATTSG